MFSYDRSQAIAYAHRWAVLRNPRYYNFDQLGGDCTNFISQCLYAGCGVMDFRNPGGWYYHSAHSRSPSWTGVAFLYDFLTRAEDTPGPCAVLCDLGSAQPGDILQLSFDGARFSHSLLIVERSAHGLLVAAHSDDCDYRPLGTYTFQKVRVLCPQ